MKADDSQGAQHLVCGVEASAHRPSEFGCSLLGRSSARFSSSYYVGYILVHVLVRTWYRIHTTCAGIPSISISEKETKQ